MLGSSWSSAASVASYAASAREEKAYRRNKDQVSGCVSVDAEQQLLHTQERKLANPASAARDMSGHFYNNKSSSLIDQTLELQPDSPGDQEQFHFF